MKKVSLVNISVLKTPIYLSVFYIALTLVIYVLCPYDWPTKKPVLFWILNLFYIFALFIGYNIGLKYDFRIKWIEWTEEKSDKLTKVLSFLIIVNFIIYLIHVFRCYAFKSFDFTNLFKQMVVGIKNPGLGYIEYAARLEGLEGSDVLGGTVYTLLNLMYDFFKNVVTILCVMYFSKLKVYGKIFTVAYMSLVVLFYISIGTNIQFFHIVLFVLLPVILHAFDLAYEKKLTKKRLIKTLAIIMIGVMIFAGYFAFMMESRSDASGYEIDEYTIGGISPSQNEEPSTSLEPSTSAPKELSPLMQKINNLWISFSSYLTQGYYGMSQALELEWVPMYGIGNSMFLVDIISGNIYDVDKFTYQVRLEPYGWDSNVRWHSIYTWIANDVSFYGIIVVMFLLGIVFAMMFRDAIVEKNPFARASMFFFILLLIFIPCNNQVAQSSENLCAFLVLIILWFLCGRKHGKEESVKI